MDFYEAMLTMLPYDSTPRISHGPYSYSTYGDAYDQRDYGSHWAVDITTYNPYINSTHPIIYPSISGTVIYSELGDMNAVKIKDDNGYVHEYLHLNERLVSVSTDPENPNRVISGGDNPTPIGTMGGWGPNGSNHYPIHLHYYVNDPSGKRIDPIIFWNYTVNGITSNFELVGDSGDDIFHGSAENETFIGNDGNDTFYIIGKNDKSTTEETYYPTDDYDTFHGGKGYDKILGSYGKDVIRLNTLSVEDSIQEIDGYKEEGLPYREDFLVGTNGIDFIDLSKTKLRSIDRILTGDGMDELILGFAIPDGFTGDSGVDWGIYEVNTGDDNDTVKLEILSDLSIIRRVDGGEGERDTIEGSVNGETFDLRPEAETNFITNFEIIKTGGGNDIIKVQNLSKDNVSLIDGGENEDGSEDEDILMGTAQADTINLYDITMFDVEKIETGAENDTIKLGEEVFDIKLIDGGSGDSDTLIGSMDDDNISLGAQQASELEDPIIAITGIEIVDGAGGNDKFYWSNTTQVKSLNGGSGENEIIGSNSLDVGDVINLSTGTIEATNIQIIRGGLGADVIIGNNENSIIYGGADKESNDGSIDYLQGKGGYDQYFTGDGDRIYDTDHRGSVHFEDTRLTGGKKEEGKNYWEGNGGIYTLSDGILTFKLGEKDDDGPSVTIVNYSKKQNSLGIYLEDDKKTGKNDFNSPLVLDLNNNGILSVTEYESPAYFDLDGDGFREKTGWIESGDGLLALDKNQNGTIDNGNELFGNYTRNDKGNYFDNGFAALSIYDIGEDGVINRNDDIYSSLRVWTDENQDGISQADELHTLESLHIDSIDLNAQEISETEGLNRITHESTFVQQQVDEEGNVLTDEEGDPITQEIAVKDVWFYRRSADTLYEFDQEIPSEVLALPDMKGAGSEFQLVQAC